MDFSSRKYILLAIICLVSLVILIKLFYLQIVDKSYKSIAENISTRIEIEYPARGLIYDRKGELLVYNQPSYALMIAPYELREFDSLKLCKFLDIDIQRLRNGLKKAWKSRYDPFIKQLLPETYAKLQEVIYEFPGFYFKARTLRKYNHEIAAHILGYVGEVDSKTVKDFDYYEDGDYIGISGVEKSYENILRGEKGKRVYLVDNLNKTIGPYEKGTYDKDAVVGKDIDITIDFELQKYCEELMKNYTGSVVAIEPSTGEILALVSSPYYNPSLFIGRQRTNNFKKLQNDTLKPLFNRATMANYPPGSIFKPLQALIGLQEGVVNRHSEFTCHLGYYYAGKKLGCHSHRTPLDLPESIQHSCNAYYCNVFRRILEDDKFNSVAEAYNNWRKNVRSFGFGDVLKTDLTSELPGLIPKTEYYDRYYGENRWKALTVISLAIGQGELLTTPVQITNYAAILANRGYYYIPHIIKNFHSVNKVPLKFTKPVNVTIDTSFFEPVINGMELAVNGEYGSTARIARIPDIVVCGKTGTAQNPHGEDNSVFIAFAPKDNPQIAISVYVEHGEWGSTLGAPIASLIIEKYLKGEISLYRKWLEKRMMQIK